MKSLLTVIVVLGSIASNAQSSFNVYFGFNQYSLPAEARTQLDSFALSHRQKQKGYSINLDGYCDAKGTEKYNSRLSLQRVSTVKTYLLQHGISSVEISKLKGHGEKDALNDNKSEEERQLNRRVQISFIEVVQTNAPGSEQAKTLLEKIADTAAKKGTHIVLKNINFVGGRHQFLPESSLALEELLNAMKSYPGLVIEIQGHICCESYAEDGVDQETGTYDLSGQRAKAVYDHLIANGIEASRLSYKGFGHSMPIYPYPEQTEEERIANRRVEIKIIKK
jgi:outer membrane protein OmpA-like peptidoglycan-associated protein